MQLAMTGAARLMAGADEGWKGGWSIIGAPAGVTAGAAPTPAGGGRGHSGEPAPAPRRRPPPGDLSHGASAIAVHHQGGAFRRRPHVQEDA